VLRELAAGRTRREIAAATGTSQRTVGRLLDELEEKLGVSSACALVGAAARLGLLAVPADGTGDSAARARPTSAPQGPAVTTRRPFAALIEAPGNVPGAITETDAPRAVDP
jgi:hypothetical protein